MFRASPGPIVETTTMTDPRGDSNAEGAGAGRDPPGALLDDLQRRMLAHLPERVRVDVGLPVHAR